MRCRPSGSGQPGAAKATNQWRIPVKCMSAAGRVVDKEHNRQAITGIRPSRLSCQKKLGAQARGSCVSSQCKQLQGSSAVSSPHGQCGCINLQVCQVRHAEASRHFCNFHLTAVFQPHQRGSHVFANRLVPAPRHLQQRGRRVGSLMLCCRLCWHEACINILAGSTRTSLLTLIPRSPRGSRRCAGTAGVQT